MAPNINSTDSRVSDLMRSLPGLKVSTLAADRLAYSRDLWPRDWLEAYPARPEDRAPLAVVWPGDAGELGALVRWAADRRVGLVPFGAGSGICGGAAGGSETVTVDLKRFDRIHWIRPGSNLVRAQAGINLHHLEDVLGRHGCTLGHYPSSMMHSTLGGHLATRGAGQSSALYGKIEDLVTSLQVVTGTGEAFETGRSAGPGPGPDWTQLLVGSEGTLGFITEATLRLHAAPAHRVLHAYAFPRVASGAEAIRRLLQADLRPAVVRLHDEVASFMTRRGDAEGSALEGLSRALLPAGPGRALPWLKRRALQLLLGQPELSNRLATELAARLAPEGCLLVVGFEGDRRVISPQAKASHELLLAAGGRDLGEGPAQHWYRNRFRTGAYRSEFHALEAFTDSMVVAAPWDKLMDVYEAVHRAITPHAFVMTHFSHAYREGCSVGFTFVGHAGDPQVSRQVYDRLWTEALSSASRAGATISHHHGVGRAKTRFMDAEHGTSLTLLRALKAALDPAGILNPGVLGLP